MWEEDLKWAQHLVSKKKQLETTPREKLNSEETDGKKDDEKIRARR